jgi:hypothetical protein
MHYVTSSHTWYDVTKYTWELQGIFTEKVDFLKTIKLVVTGFLNFFQNLEKFISIRYQILFLCIRFKKIKSNIMVRYCWPRKYGAHSSFAEF